MAFCCGAFNADLIVYVALHNIFVEELNWGLNKKKEEDIQSSHHSPGGELLDNKTCSVSVHFFNGTSAWAHGGLTAAVNESLLLVFGSLLYCTLFMKADFLRWE